MKKLFIGLFVGLMILSLTGCHDKALEEATVAVAAYNDAAESYNADIMPYNEACSQIEQVVSNLDAVIDEAQTVINACLLYTSPSPRDRQKSRMPSSA